MSDVELRTAHLFTIWLEVDAIKDLGATPYGNRRIAAVKGGRFEGEELHGTVEPAPAGDWLLQRRDGVLMLDVRLTLRTQDDALIYMTYRGMRHGPQWVMDRLNKGEKVDPSEYYFRTAPMFETASEKYSFLNRIMSIGVGRREAAGPIYDIFQVL
ncbi:DUF3237 domain-containing protein [Vineibacter terrae]|uniref:UPF0311 protein FHP25_37290 n=1 Tax=Vineibacter terrae TaxID=2586908 RepID=A0A5C8P7U2_9HYPH|nr:DUF3237 domain-containing protein [Vineibacter terrae]TXL69814.1 DUF3237 domain-containing protein [Vineibacter terrae]